MRSIENMLLPLYKIETFYSGLKRQEDKNPLQRNYASEKYR